MVFPTINIDTDLPKKPGGRFISRPVSHTIIVEELKCLLSFLKET